MPINIVLLNGPSGSGKTTLGREAAKRLNHSAIAFGFADDLKRATHAAYGMFDVPFDQFESCKNTPMEEFFGLTPRQAYIKHSEDYMKPAHGKDVFSKMAVRKIRRLASKNLDYRHDTFTQLIVMTDCGFQEEVEHFVQHFGKPNVLLIRLRRPGKTFTGDSRNYVFTNRANAIWFDNDGSFEEGVVSLCATIVDYFVDAAQNADAISL